MGFSDFWAQGNPTVTTFELSGVTDSNGVATDFDSWKLFVANADPAGGYIKGFKYTASGSSGLLEGTAQCAPAPQPFTCGSGGKVVEGSVRENTQSKAHDPYHVFDPLHSSHNYLDTTMAFLTLSPTERYKSITVKVN